MPADPFTYETEGGKTVTLPPIEEIPYGVLRKIKKLDADDQDDALLEAVADEETLEVIDSLSVREVMTMVVAWEKASKVTMGEQLASTDS